MIRHSSRKVVVSLAFAFLAAVAHAQSGLRVDIQSSRSQEDVYRAADQAIRAFGKNAATLTRRAREVQGIREVFSLPMVVRLFKDGAPLRSPSGRGEDLSLQFGTGARAFPPEYQEFLQSVFAKSQAVMTALFGAPSVGGNVLVSNYDSDIGDRDAVAGGYYIPNNGQGQQEIRFPVYSDIVGFKKETTAVNFIHCLLLAYLGPNGYPFDAYNEGIVRAVTMWIARTPSALPPDIDQALVDGVLDATYEIGAFYDWNNQPALGAPLFIAPNLRSTPLPIGGSTGGVYLLRYQMAGTAWQKALLEYPGFVAALNQAYYSNPAANNTPEKLALLVQGSIASQGGATVEGLSPTNWLQRQSILQCRNIAGVKSLIQPFPIVGGLGGDDYGVFGVQAHAFSTARNGDELLLSGTSYPIFWGVDFVRFFTSGQDDVISIHEGYGAVAPNFPDALGVPYRVTVDLPVADRTARCALPAGAVATASQPTPNNFYGTLSGPHLQSSVDYAVRVEWPGGTSPEIPATGLAFGALLESGFEKGQSITITVLKKVGIESSVVLTRKVNKSPGSLGVDLWVGEVNTYGLPNGLQKGLQMIGFPLTPFETDAAAALGIGASEALIARYDSDGSRYAIYPDCGILSQGNGFFIRAATGKSLTIEGRTLPQTPYTVALKPGWNMIACPLMEEVPLSRVQVIVATQFPIPWNGAVGDVLGTELFSFTPGNPDTVTGAPEGGTFMAASGFAPGKAYFVRVLNPEGASLVFYPASASAPSNSNSPSAGRSAWTMSATLEGGGEIADVRFGQARGASRGADTRFDSPLPPRAAGGLTTFVMDHGALYRDMRQYGRAETYKIKFEGLTPGTMYRVKFRMIEKTVERYNVYDPSTKKTRKYTKPGVYTFRASAKNQWLEVSVPGWK